MFFTLNVDPSVFLSKLSSTFTGSFICPSSSTKKKKADSNDSSVQTSKKKETKGDRIDQSQEGKKGWKKHEKSDSRNLEED